MYIHIYTCAHVYTCISTYVHIYVSILSTMLQYIQYSISWIFHLMMYPGDLSISLYKEWLHFFEMATWALTGWMYCNLFNHPPNNRYLSSLQIFFNSNSAAMNTFMYMYKYSCEINFWNGNFELNGTCVFNFDIHFQIDHLRWLTIY